MEILNHETFRLFVRKEQEKLSIPTSSVRRVGAEDGAGISFARGSLDGIYELLDEGVIDPEKASIEITDAVLEMTSSLYSAGAEHQIWRRWASLTAFGMFITGQIHQAAQYAALGGEWEFIKVLPAKPVNSQQLSERVLWTLVGGKPIPDLSKIGTDDEDNAWLRLAESIPAQENDQTEAALKAIADFWMAEIGDEWMNFEPGNYPDFHPQACAVAAIARHYDFTPTSLTPDQYRFLEAGLAIPEPSRLFPEYFSLPGS